MSAAHHQGAGGGPRGPSGIDVNADDAVWDECPSSGCRCPDVGSAVLARHESPGSFRADVAGSPGVWLSVTV